MSEKIKPQHLARKAVLYVRQSSAIQVAQNQESQRLQYAMQERLRELGWTEIEVIDEDLGRSAAGTAARSGFERMVAEVCLGQVGGVAARPIVEVDEPIGVFGADGPDEDPRAVLRRDTMGQLLRIAGCLTHRVSTRCPNSTRLMKTAICVAGSAGTPQSHHSSPA